VRLLYYAIAVCIYNAWCVSDAHRQEGGHVIALEAKLSILLTFLVPLGSADHPDVDDH